MPNNFERESELDPEILEFLASNGADNEYDENDPETESRRGRQRTSDPQSYSDNIQ